jgi:lipoprotein-anchoring transpeptidase ErfK/SrfK
MSGIKKPLNAYRERSVKHFILLALVTVGAVALFYGAKSNGKFSDTNVAMRKITDVGFQEPVIIDFSVPVQVKYWNTSIKIIPAVKYGLRWEESDKKLTIIPDDFWKPDTEYKVLLPEGKNALYSDISLRTFYFTTRKYPEVASVIPNNGAEDSLIGIEDPIRIDFKKSVSDFFIKFVLDPESDLSIQNNPEKTWFKLLPVDGVKYATRYNLKIYAKYAKDSEDGYQQIYESSFTTAPPPKVEWDKNQATRLEQAREYSRPKINIGKYVDINLTAQILSIFEDGKFLDAYMISSGKRGMETPKGQTSIFNKSPRAYSRDYGLFMPYWMALAGSGSFGIHELPEWPGGFKEGAAHLGIPVSHGCVRLGVGPAKRVYEWADIGTPVVIY